MNPTIFLVILGQLNFVFSAISDDEYRLETLCSSPALEHFDITPILKNDRLVSSYFKCFMDEGPCTNEGKMVKSKLRFSLILAKFNFQFSRYESYVQSLS